MDIQKGDCFVVKTDGWISAPIRWIERLKSLDGKATYNHAGIIVDENGNTFESLERIDHYKLSDYKGKQILIFRHKAMTDELFEVGYKEVLKYDGKVYPVWRMALYLIGLAKWIHITYLMCSELVDYLEYSCKLRDAYAGYSPDNIADEVHISKFHQIKFEGVLT